VTGGAALFRCISCLLCFFSLTAAALPNPLFHGHCSLSNNPNCICFISIITMPPRSKPLSVTASRERNRVHAQKTRQRKKEQMLTLKTRAAELKDEQIRLKQMINEKATATILVHLFAEGSSPDQVEYCNIEDPAVEELLRRDPLEIPDASHIQDLPALILPGQHASKKINKSNYTQPLPVISGIGGGGVPSCDDIDYELLGRDRSQCSPDELDRIRRERNRMHAKRTRDRKRIYTEKLSELCHQLEDENILLHEHAKKIDPNYEYTPVERTTTMTTTTAAPSFQGSTTSNNHKFDNQIATLLEAAERELHEISDAASACGSEEQPPRKKQRVPGSIATV